VNVDLSQFLRRPTPRSAAVLLLVMLLVGLGAGLLVNAVRPALWKASTDALVRTWTIDSLLISGTATPVTTQDQADAATVAVSRQVLERAAQQLGDGRTGEQLALAVTATPVAGSHLVTISATGPDRDTAERTSQAAATAFADVTRQNLVVAAGALTSTPAGQDDPAVVLRSQLLAKSLEPIQVYSTAQPQQLSPSVQVPLALAIVGLAAGALVLVLLYRLRPAVTGARDAQRVVGLPAVEHADHNGAATARLVARMTDLQPHGELLVCPLDAAVEKDSLELVEWIRERVPDPRRIQSVPEPTSAVLASTPRPGTICGLVMVVPVGTPRDVLRDATTLLDSWRSVDALIVIP
jgi:capsular polysaccharide biosynthesis protein